MSKPVVQFHRAPKQDAFVTFRDAQHHELKVSTHALKHLQSKCAEHSEYEGLRIFLDKKGCSGYSYEIQHTTQTTPEDVSFRADQNNLAIIVANHDLPKVAGVSIDYRVEGINKKLTFTHPLVKGTCGCGESVTF